jgi:SAM-dependent methyltransferase
VEENQCRLYDDLAWTWPIISPPEDYIEETEELCKAIREYSQITAKTLLNLGCGGGHNDYTLKKHFDVTGVDLSESMLSLAKRLNPDVTYLSGDMCNVELGNTFDAVVITDAITYMLTEDALRAALTTAFIHLKPGGVFFTFAEITRERFQQNSTEYSAHTQGDIEITFIENIFDPNPTDTTYQTTFVYLIRRRGQSEVDVKTDYHLGGIFSLKTWLSLLKEVGFEVEQIELKSYDFPTFICLKPLECKF